jgi:transcriptional regulator with XRE-family HTH domain
MGKNILPFYIGDSGVMVMNKDNLDAMSDRIKARRKSMGYTQEKMALKLGISYSSYTKIENGFQQPSLDTLIDISFALKVSLDNLVFGKTESTEDFLRILSNLLPPLKSCDPDTLSHAGELLGTISNYLKLQAEQTE